MAAAARAGRLQVAGIGQQHGELVATQPGHHLGGRPQQLLESPAQLDEQPVAVVVAQGVVDLLELVQVHDQQRHRLQRLGRPAQRAPQPVGQVRAVGQAGQAVVEGLAAESGGRGDLVGHVQQRDPHRAAGQREDVGREDGRARVVGIEAHLVEAEALALADHLGQGLADQVGAGLVDVGRDVDQAPTDGGAGRGAGRHQPGAHRVDGQQGQAAVVVGIGQGEHEQGHVHVLHQVQVLGGLLLGQLAGRDVDHDARGRWWRGCCRPPRRACGPGARPPCRPDARTGTRSRCCVPP